MCYTNIKPVEPLKQEVYYKILYFNNNSYRGIFTHTLLPKKHWINAVNVLDNLGCTYRVYLKGFKGFGVFSRKSTALKYLNSHSDRLMFSGLKIVSVLCGGGVKKALIKANESNITCYIFDKIKIVD